MLAEQGIIIEVSAKARELGWPIWATIRNMAPVQRETGPAEGIGQRTGQTSCWPVNLSKGDTMLVDVDPTARADLQEGRYPGGAAAERELRIKHPFSVPRTDLPVLSRDGAGFLWGEYTPYAAVLH